MNKLPYAYPSTMFKAICDTEKHDGIYFTYIYLFTSDFCIGQFICLSRSLLTTRKKLALKGSATIYTIKMQ